MIALTLMAVLAADPFPLPMVDGKPPALTEGQKHFRLPMRFEKVRDFYLEQFSSVDRKLVSVTPSRKGDIRVLQLTSKRAGDGWRSAVIREGVMETTIDIVPVLQLATEEITAHRQAPLVQFVFMRSPEVQKSLESIDHTEALRER